LLAASPAREAVPTNAAPLFDQRGIGRPQGAIDDIGAFEFVATLPTLTVQPTNASKRAGETFSFQTFITGPVALGFFWLKEGVPLPGAASSTLLFSSLQNSDNGNYVVVATNTSGAITSSVARLTVDSTPLPLTQPSDLSLPPSGSSNFLFLVDGPALTYTWFHNNV